MCYSTFVGGDVPDAPKAENLCLSNGFSFFIQSFAKKQTRLLRAVEDVGPYNVNKHLTNPRFLI